MFQSILRSSSHGRSKSEAGYGMQGGNDGSSSCGSSARASKRVSHMDTLRSLFNKSMPRRSATSCGFAAEDSQAVSGNEAAATTNISTATVGRNTANRSSVTSNSGRGSSNSRPSIVSLFSFASKSQRHVSVGVDGVLHEESQAAGDSSRHRTATSSNGAGKSKTFSVDSFASFMVRYCTYYDSDKMLLFQYSMSCAVKAATCCVLSRV